MIDYDIWVDFNDLDDGSHATSWMDLAHRPDVIEPGRTVLAGDDEGNRCSARVVRVGDGGAVVLALDLGSFAPAPEDGTRTVDHD